MVADHRRQLEAVDVRHDDVEQDDRDVVLQNLLQRLAAGLRLDQILIEVAQDDFVAEQLCGLIIHQENIDAVPLGHRPVPSGAATS